MDVSLIDRLEAAVLRLESLETLPKPYDIYYAIKQPGEGSGWTYATTGIGVAELREALDALKASQPLDPRYNPGVITGEHKT
jgi:hypothetical protein